MWHSTVVWAYGPNLPCVRQTKHSFKALIKAVLWLCCCACESITEWNWATGEREHTNKVLDYKPPGRLDSTHSHSTKHTFTKDKLNKHFSPLAIRPLNSYLKPPPHILLTCITMHLLYIVVCTMLLWWHVDSIPVLWHDAYFYVFVLHNIPYCTKNNSTIHLSIHPWAERHTCALTKTHTAQMMFWQVGQDLYSLSNILYKGISNSIAEDCLPRLPTLTDM